MSNQGAFLEADAGEDPFALFGTWFAAAAAVMADPEAMALATVGPDGRPGVRMVLLKRWDHAGFVFHTNFASAKAHALDTTGRAALLWHWAPLGRQVRVEGTAARVDDAEADAYFATRPRGAQLGAHASRQSAVIASREELEARVAEQRRHFAGQPVPRPPWWGGYRVVPVSFEFWQHRDDRLHDRLRFLASASASPSWQRVRLQP